MKKKVLSVVLSAAMASAVLAGCGSKGSDTAATEAGSAATEAATAAATEAAAATTEAADTAAINGGRVYLLNFKPETDEAWQELASKYNDLGGNVTVLTAADGQYATTLQSEMAKSEAPTIFNIGNANDVATWKDYLYDLRIRPLRSRTAMKHTASFTTRHCFPITAHWTTRLSRALMTLRISIPSRRLRMI